MPSDERHDQRSALNRRKYVQAILAASLGGVAGCGGDGGNTPTETRTSTDTPSSTPGESTRGDTPTATEVAPDDTPTEDTSTEDTPTEEESTPTATPRDPVSDTITVAINNVPQQSNLNPWAATVKDRGLTWFSELTNPYNITQAEYRLSGHTYRTPWMADVDSISIPTVLKDLRVEPPFDRYRTLDDRLHYWDGTPIDAKARLMHDYVWYGVDGHLFDKTETFNHEVVSQWEYHSWRDKGKVAGQTPKPTNQFILKSNSYWSGPPLHPDFVRPYYESYRDAGSASEAQSVTDQLVSDNVSYFRFAEEQWGSGLYRIESADDVTSNRVLARKWEDHPNDHATIPRLQAKFASADRQQVLIDQGVLDIGGGVVQDNAGTWNRTQLPSYIQEVDRFLQDGSDQLLFNWNNDHLARLWVRRAIVAAIDWIAVGRNGWGPERSIPITHHTGLGQTASKANFSDSFLEKLYTYPMRSNFDLARKWMAKAGYTKTGGTWIGPNGEPIELDFKYNSAIRDWVGWAQTVKSNLMDFGIKVNMTGVNWPAFGKLWAPENLNYDIATMWASASPDVWKVYKSQGSPWAEPLLGGDPNEDPVRGSSVDPDDTHDTQGAPLKVEIPREVGSIDAPDRAGAAPDLPDGREIDLAEVIQAFRDPDVSEERFREAARLCARYYNFYLNDFRFHQYTWGLVGNVRDFDFAPRGHPSNRTQKGFGTDDYQVLGGIPEAKYTEDYEKP